MAEPQTLAKIPMKTAIVLLLAALSMTVCSAADSKSRFSCGYAHFDALPNDVRAAAIERLNSESAAVAEQLLGKEICEGLKVAVRWSDGNTNGFATWFECPRSLEFALGRERFGALHEALGVRYEELLTAANKGQEIPPLSEFLARYAKKG